MASGNPALRHLTIACIADADAVGTLVTAARTFGASLPPETAARLAIIAEELVSNLIDHAEMNADATIEITLAQEAACIWLTLIDQAPAFDPRRAVSNDIPARGGSAGLALVRAWAEIKSYDRINGRNVLTLSLPIS